MCGPATLTSYARGSTDERHLTLFVFVSRGSPLTCLSLCISLSLSLSVSLALPIPLRVSLVSLTRLSHSLSVSVVLTHIVMIIPLYPLSLSVFFSPSSLPRHERTRSCIVCE